MNKNQLLAIRGSVLHCLRDPGDSDNGDAIEFFEDGLLLIQNGRIDRLGPAGALLTELLFALIMLGDDRAVAATYVLGRRIQLAKH